MRTPGTGPAAHNTSTADTLAAGATEDFPLTKAPRSRGGGRAVVASVLALAVLGGGGYVAYTELAGRGGAERVDDDGSDSSVARDRARSNPVTPPVGGGGAGAEPLVAGNTPPPAEDRFIVLEVTGAPEGTEVLGPTGPIGAAPGRVQLPRGEEKVLLTFRAPGYKPLTREVEPRADGALEVALERAESPAATQVNRDSGKKRRKKAPGDSSGGDHKPAGDDKNTIEDPF